MKRTTVAVAACAALALCILGTGVHPAFDARALGEYAPAL